MLKLDSLDYALNFLLVNRLDGNGLNQSQTDTKPKLLVWFEVKFYWSGLKFSQTDKFDLG